jgi:hypothetical protein
MFRSTGGSEHQKGAAWQRFFNTPLKVIIDIQAT